MNNKSKFLFLIIVSLFFSSCVKNNKEIVEENKTTLSPLATKIINSDEVERYSFNNNIEEYNSILFGKNDTVEWIVLKKDDDSFILLSKYILDVEHYNKSNDCSYWDDSTLRVYLNNEFLNNYFSDTDIKKMEPIYNEDYVTIMSLNDVEKYFVFLNKKEDDFYGNNIITTPNKKLITKGIEEIDIERFDNELYAKSLLSNENEEIRVDKKFDYANGMSDYWLRDIEDNNAKYVESLGYMNECDFLKKKGIRPMIRIKKQ